MIVTSSLYEGGAERVIAHLAKHIDRSRFQVTIAYQQERGGVGERLAASGYDVVGTPASQGRIGRYLSSRALSRVVRDRGIDLLHTHTTGSLTDGALCRLRTLGRVKLVHTFHFGNYPHCPRRHLLMERFASRAANHLVAVGIEQMAVLRSLFHAASPRMSAVLNGTERPSSHVDAEWSERLARDGRVVIGTTAVFTEQKGLDYLLDVARIFERERVKAVFVVAGEGPLRAKIEQRCRAMGLKESVLFAGWKANAGSTITPLYDVLLQPSLWEAMSVVVLEAMAAGKPVVVTDVGDNRHVVADGSTGFVVPSRDVEAMADRLRRLVASETLRRQFGATGRRRYEERYTAEAMTRAYESLYDRVLADGSTVRGNRENDACLA
jgi:glycosyltransferase involved in cell wall biosynthesis